MSSVFNTSRLRSAASFLMVSKVLMTVSSSKMAPWTALILFNRDSSNSLNLKLCSPWSCNTIVRRWSTSGRSAFKIELNAWDSRDAGVTVKLIVVTREHKSGAKRASGLRVIKITRNFGEKSMSSFPKRIRVRPPVRCNSLFKTGFKMGSIFSTSFTNNGVPKRMALANVFKKVASINEVWTIFWLLYFWSKKFAAWPEGSITKGYRWNFSRRIAFWMARSSVGKPNPLHRIWSAGVDKYETMSKSCLNGIPISSRVSDHSNMRLVLTRWSNIPP